MGKNMSKLIEEANEELANIKHFKDFLIALGKEYITEYLIAWKAINSQERDKLNNNEECELSYYFPVCTIKNKYDNTNFQWLVKKNPKFAVTSLKNDRHKYKLSETLKDRFSYSEKYFTKSNSWDYSLIKSFEVKIAPIRKILSKLQKLIVTLDQITSVGSLGLTTKHYSVNISVNFRYEYIDELIPFLFNCKGFVQSIYNQNKNLNIAFAETILPFDIVVKTNLSAGEGEVHLVVPEQLFKGLEKFVENGNAEEFFINWINRDIEEEVEDIYQSHMHSYFEDPLKDIVYKELIQKHPILEGILSNG